MKYQKNDQWLEAQAEDGLLMMHCDSGSFVSLNGTGTFLWNRLDVPRDVDSLARELTVEFEVGEDQARVDVELWLAEMRRHNLVSEDAG